ncbi:MAG: chorismate mutase, partial [Gemmatimonadales bacterium]
LRRGNNFEVGDLVSAIFTVTPDLTSAFPAESARRAGWEDVPLLCSAEIAVPGSLPRCLRVLLHIEQRWDAPPAHVYLRDAVALRPDLRHDRAAR